MNWNIVAILVGIVGFLVSMGRMYDAEDEKTIAPYVGIVFCVLALVGLGHSLVTMNHDILVIRSQLLMIW